MKKLVLVLLMLVLGAGVALAETRTHADQIWYRVHLGQGVGNNALTPEVALRFVDKEISPLFPAGMTVTRSHGQWASPQGEVIRERVTVIDIQCDSTPENEARIAAIAEAYLRQFGKVKASCFVMRIPGISTQLWY